jgi:hypothetical protein
MQRQARRTKPRKLSIFPSGDKTAEVVQPCKEPLDFPVPAVAPQFAVILTTVPVTPVGRDHLDAVFLLEPAVERVRVVGLVTDEPRWEMVQETSGQNVFHKLALGRRSAVDRYSEWKTVVSGDSNDFRALAFVRYL